jgi:hypothetical protein
MTNRGVSAGRGARLALAAMMTVLSMGVLEVAIRAIGRTDQDGNFHMGRRQVLPLHLPISRLEDAVREYRQSSQALFTDDASLGWKPRPGAHNELYAYNAAGLRARTIDEVPAPPVAGSDPVRVAVFGDSFAHGSEVGFDESWSTRVQQALQRPDRPVEVLNFGVPGYGMDQAFLRWQHEGRGASPDVVVFGLQIENAGRNLNLLRVLYDSADLPFAKPRFVEVGDRLDVVNVPVPPPEQVVEILRTLDDWPLIGYERYYEAAKYRDRPWRHSRLVGMIEGLASGGPRTQSEAELPEEQRRLALRIIDGFARSVRETGARFVIVHFPRRMDLEAARKDGRLPNVDFLNAVSGIAPLVRIDQVLLARAGDGDLTPLFSPGGHYSPDGYALLAAAVVDRLQAELAPVARRAVGHIPTGTH